MFSCIAKPVHAGAIGLAGAALLCGCATNIPESIRTPPSTEVHISEVRANPQNYQGADVRWGGEIVSVKNQRNATIVEVADRSLDNDGRPRSGANSNGRFLARVSGFVDPTVFASGRKLTVRGQVEKIVEQPIGEFPYRYPLVHAHQIYLWEPLPPPGYYDPYVWQPYWYPFGWPSYGYWPRYGYRPPYWY